MSIALQQSHSNQRLSKNICILGSTGSIGRSTLDVISRNPEYRVQALAAGTNDILMLEQCKKFQPQYAILQNETSAKRLASAVTKLGLKTEVLSGLEAMCQIARDPGNDTVMSAIVGAAGLLPTMAAVEAGKKILLANKESLVMSGQLFIDKVQQHNAILLPIDSEHNAIFQCMPRELKAKPFTASLQQNGVHKILLTGSGGPFLTRDIATLSTVTPEEAIAHPNWDMGKKISVDSATMMNKGLEFIEAKWLFNADVDDIEVVIHPQSIIHSMVQYQDGSVIAQMGEPDMRTPIAHALAFPERIQSGVNHLDFTQVTDFSFSAPDFVRYPNLKLAMDACRIGQAATTIINAANEISVSVFLSGEIGFSDIYTVNAKVLDKLVASQVNSLEEILALDTQAREFAWKVITEGIH